MVIVVFLKKPEVLTANAAEAPMDFFVGCVWFGFFNHLAAEQHASAISTGRN